MKSLTAVCQTGASMPAMKPQSGRVARPPQHRGNGENAEMRMYLSKLKDLVPFMPKNRKLSKLEIIQHVIDYICELQTELESHPDIDSYDGARELLSTPNRHFALEAVANMTGNDEADDEEEQDMNGDNNDVSMQSNADRLAADAAIANQQQQQQSSPAARQPLVDRNPPNTFLPANALASAVMQLQQTTAASVAAAAAAAITTTASSAPASATQQQQQSTLMAPTEKEQSRRNC